MILKIAVICGTDAEKSIADVLKEYEERFPVEQARYNHGNALAGGIDLKDN